MQDRALIALPLLLSLVLPASAQGETERYRLEKAEDGFVRMDTATGAISTCREQAGQFVCRMAVDEREAATHEAERLQTRIEALEERVGKLENSLATRLDSTLPTEEEFDKTMSYVERFFRSFMGIVKDMEKRDTHEPQPAPNRT